MCRSAYTKIAALAETFSDWIWPAPGIVTTPSQASSVARGSPSSSLPSTSATGFSARRSASSGWPLAERGAEHVIAPAQALQDRGEARRTVERDMLEPALGDAVAGVGRPGLLRMVRQH